MRKVHLVALALVTVLLPAGLAAGAPGNPLEGLYQLKAGEAMRASSCDANWRNGNGDARPIAPGATLTVAELAGPGVINHIWNTIAANERGYAKLLVLRMYWDGEEKPSVETPIGDFFGIGHGMDVPFESLPVTVTSDGRGRNCYWPMPFRKSARITVTNEGSKPIGAFYYYVDWQKVPRLPRKTAHFHAMYRQEFPTVMGRNYLIADIEGRGHYVGTVQSVRQHLASWWGEGDDFFFIDGEQEPSLRGTGSEDYFCDGWGFREMSTPYYGAPLVQPYEPYNCCSVYRWHLTDPILFDKSLRVEIEHKGVTFNEDGSIKSGFEEREDDFATVAFWYQTEPHKPYPDMPKGYARLYYDYANALEMEASLGEATATAGPISTQDGGWSGGAQLFWTPQEPNQTLTIPFTVKEAGNKLMIPAITHSWDYGIFQFELDGKPVGKPLDLYNASVATRDHLLGPVELAVGPHVMTVRNVGKNPESKGVYFGIDAIIFGK